MSTAPTLQLLLASQQDHENTSDTCWMCMQELRLQFLQCREEYMAEVIEDLEEQSAYDYLKRLTDIHRLHLFDVVMQYRAIFSDDQSAQVSCHLTRPRYMQ